MFYSAGGFERPTPAFNFLHLEKSELHIFDIKASILISPGFKEVKGKLHICSRGLFFEPKDINLPLLKLKFSNGLKYRQMKSIERGKLETLPHIFFSQIFTEHLEEKIIASSGDEYKNKLMEKLFNEGAKEISESKTLTPVVLSVSKLFTIHRNPVTPYVAENSISPLLLDLSSNSKESINLFFKIFGRIERMADESSFKELIVEEALNDAIREYKEVHVIQDITFISKVQFINYLESIHGILSVLNSKTIVFTPVINKFDWKPIEFGMERVKAYNPYRHHFQHNGIEIWAQGLTRSHLYVFKDLEKRGEFLSLLKGSDLSDLKELLPGLQEEWSQGRISNFEYLMYLNASASRSFNDFSAYPVFPWLINDFSSTEISFDDPSIFRDLSRSVGAQNRHKLQKLKEFYMDMVCDKLGEKPYIFISHYSIPGYIIYFLIRKVPELIIRLQNSIYTPAEKIFRSIEDCYYSTISLGSDNKELIPEFYDGQCEFLQNGYRLDMGISQDGTAIDNAVLPEWSKSNHDFAVKMRASLECEYVSTQLNSWIDLIFGYKQRGELALRADNLFYPYAYEENVHWKSFRNRLEIDAMITQVSEFGQIPEQLFRIPHEIKKGLKFYLNIKDINDNSDLGIVDPKMISLANELERIKADFEKYKQDSAKLLNLQQQEFKKIEEKKQKIIDKLRKESNKEK